MLWIERNKEKALLSLTWMARMDSVFFKREMIRLCLLLWLRSTHTSWEWGSQPKMPMCKRTQTQLLIHPYISWDQLHIIEPQIQDTLAWTIHCLGFPIVRMGDTWITEVSFNTSKAIKASHKHSLRQCKVLLVDYIVKWSMKGGSGITCLRP
jgi:hypothetical protein